VLLLIDGYNLLYQTDLLGRGRGEGWLQRGRERLLATLAARLDADVAARTCVVFDSRRAPPDLPARFRQCGIEVRYAIDHDEADDLLEEMIRAHPTPRRLAVVSSDHRIRRAARRRGSVDFEAQAWYQRMIEGDAPLAIRSQTPTADPAAEKPRLRDEEELRRWLAEFGFHAIADEPGDGPAGPAVGRLPEAARSHEKSSAPQSPADRPPSPRARIQPPPLPKRDPTRSRRPLSGDGTELFPEGYGDDLLDPGAGSQ
jgi:uncharacterized protein